MRAEVAGLVLSIPWFSQFDAEHVDRAGKTACFRACCAMAAAAGVKMPVSTEKRTQLASGEDAGGRIIPIPKAAGAAAVAIRNALLAGAPVIAGVNHKRGSLNRDGITDHFVLVVGMGVGADFPEVFLALDPGRALDAGTSHSAEFALEGDALVRTWPRRGRWLEMQVSMLVFPEGMQPAAGGV